VEPESWRTLGIRRRQRLGQEHAAARDPRQQWIDPDGGERAYGFDGTPRGAMTAPRTSASLRPSSKNGTCA